jgi:hypothetical protein
MITIIIFAAIGFTINGNPSGQEPVSLGSALQCWDSKPFANRSFAEEEDWMIKIENMSMHQSLIISASVFLPITPLLLNSQTTFNRGKLNALLAHIFGQSASFGTTEMTRHFLVQPNWHFFRRCNLSLPECQSLAPGRYALAKAPLNNTVKNSTVDNAAAINLTANADDGDDEEEEKEIPRALVLCPRPTTSLMKELFDSLHSMPDVCSALVGSSSVIFVMNIWFWELSNKNRKHVSASHDLTKVILVCIFLIYVSVSLFYRFRYVDTHFMKLAFSFMYGAGIQTVISLLYQKEK